MNIIWKRPDGGVSVTQLTPEAITANIDILDHAEELKSNGSIPSEWEMVATAIDLPADRNFRNAWTWTTADPVIDICPVRACDITKDRLRAERALLLASLDVQYIRALESGEDIAAIVTEKQRLRDITKLADLASTLEELKSIHA